MDVQLPGLGGEPRGFPLPRELVDRVPAPQPDRDLQDFRATGPAGAEHHRLPRDRRPQLHRGPGRARPPDRDRDVRGPLERGHLRRGAHPRRAPGVLPALLFRWRMGRVVPGHAHDQGPPCRPCGVPRPRLPVLARLDGVQRATTVATGRAGVFGLPQSGNRPVRRPWRQFQHVLQRQLGAAPVCQGQALRQAVLRPDDRLQHAADRGALHAEGAGARRFQRLRRQPLGRRVPPR